MPPLRRTDIEGRDGQSQHLVVRGLSTKNVELSLYEVVDLVTKVKQTRHHHRKEHDPSDARRPNG